MIILDEPYVSQILKDIITEMKVPVLKNKTSERLGFNKDVKLLENAEFIELLKNQKTCKIYSNSEISLVWIANNLRFTGILEKIGLFKDKFRFRQLIEHIYPDFSYQGVKFESLDELDMIETEAIEAFDYKGFVSRFEKPLELRKLDYRQYPVFAFLFTETKNSNLGEAERYLRADLKEYVKVKTKNCS